MSGHTEGLDVGHVLFVGRVHPLHMKQNPAVPGPPPTKAVSMPERRATDLQYVVVKGPWRHSDGLSELVTHLMLDDVVSGAETH